jgi:hypothetical protein
MKQIEKRLTQLETKVEPARVRLTIRVFAVGRDAEGNWVKELREVIHTEHGGDSE